MSQKETLLYRLVELMLEKQQTFLQLDDLCDDEIAGTFIRNIQIDSPYQQLLFEGVLSQFLQNDELLVSITVENYFHHLLGLILQNDERYQSSESLIQLVKSNNLKGLKESVSNLLSFDIEKENFTRITKLIDLSEGEEDVLEMSVMPLVNSLIIHGTQKTIDVIFENSTEYDWISLIILDNKLDNLSLHELRVLFLDYLMTLNPLNSKLNIWIGLIAISILEADKAIYYLEKIDVLPLIEDDDTDILFQMGIIESNFGNFNKAYEFYKKCISIQIKKFGLESTEVAESFNNVGLLLNKIDYKKSLKYYFKSLEIYVKKIERDVESNKASIYNNIAEVYYYKNNFKEALNLYNNSLDIKLKIHGKNHPSIAVLYNNIGALLKSQGKYEKALIYYYKCLEIESNIFGDYNSDIARTLNNIGTLLYVKSDYEKSLIYYKKSFEIRIRTLIKAHEEIVQSYFNIGLCYKALFNYDTAIINFQKCYEILKKGSFPYQIAQCYEASNQKENALDYYIQSAEIRKEDVEINEDAFQDTVINVKRLAKELVKEEELPDWMKLF